MVELRPVKAEDAPILRQELSPGAELDDIRKMIAEWGSRAFDGRYFGKLAQCI